MRIADLNNTVLVARVNSSAVCCSSAQAVGLHVSCDEWLIKINEGESADYFLWPEIANCYNYSLFSH
jgi:hypothetical protein